MFVDCEFQDHEEPVLACGYYLPYPDSAYEGLVTKTSIHLPIMNWMYVDAATYQLRYGVRKDADGNITGPFDCTNHSRRVTLHKWEGWCAVEEQPGEWAVYFDVEDNGLNGKVHPGTRVLEIELERREQRYKKEEYGVVTILGTQTVSPSSPIPIPSGTDNYPHANNRKSTFTKETMHDEKATENMPRPQVLHSEKTTHSSPASVKPSVIPAKVPPRHKANSSSKVPVYKSKRKAEQRLDGKPTIDTSRHQSTHSSHQNLPKSSETTSLALFPFLPDIRQNPHPVDNSDRDIHQVENSHSAYKGISPRFQSLDLPREKTQHPRKFSIDSIARRAFHRSNGTAASDRDWSAPAPAEPKRKLSIYKRVAKAFRKGWESK